MKRILIIDDEKPILDVLEDILKDEGYDVLTAMDGMAGLEILGKEPVDLVFLDVWMPKMGGIEVLEKIKESYSGVEVIIISGHANVDMAVKAIKIGAYDFIEKPLDIDRILNLAKNALQLQSLRRENKNLKQQLLLDDEMIGDSPAMKKVRDLITQSAPTDSRVMILGENGTGKELVARMIHNQSGRAEQNFVEVNCAAIPDTLIESELFGHEKGSFTGASAQRIGKFEAADGGTLFLDEIADMSLQAQAKVLRAVQEMKFERVGGHDPISVDVRILCATNKDIQKEISEGRFREDLYFRLNVIPIMIPPLKDRREDIPALLAYFMEKFSEKHKQKLKTISGEGMKQLADYPWPGNIRELKNFTERISVMCDEDIIPENTVLFYLREQTADRPENQELTDRYGEMKLQEARDHFEKQLLLTKLDENGFNISQTAQALGIYPSNLHNKIKKYGIEIPK
jgi:two-component system nitrogen regulation response regulator NtrX